MQQKLTVAPLASARFVYSRLTIYYSSKVDVRWQRSVHYCPVCDVPSLNDLKLTCGAIHYGWCSAPPFPSKPPLAPGCQRVHITYPKKFPKDKDTKEKLGSGERDRSKEVVISSRPVVTSASVVTTTITASTLSSTTPASPLTGTSVSTSTITTAATSTTASTTTTTTTSSVVSSVVSSVPQTTSASTNTIISSVSPSATPSNLTPRAIVKAGTRLSSKPPEAQKPLPVHENAITTIPKFYFPNGRPAPAEEIEATLQNVAAEFSKAEGGKILKHNMHVIVKALSFPLYWKSMLFRAAGGEKLGYITFQMFSSMWKKVCQTCHDDASKFVRLLAKPGSKFLVVDDFVPLIQDVVETHPGLNFLQEAREFHSRYVHTVISRIFFSVNRSWSGKITASEIRRSNFLQMLVLLEEEEDINQITDYFSYEHFYVIYCKFWELDTDHDLYIDRSDLTRHNDHAISSRMIDRIFSGAVTRGLTQKEGKMSYPEFVWFLIAEEDKKHPTSIEYWFRTMDLDGDGVLSLYEMEYFYEEQMHKMEAIGIEKLHFEDCLCQMLDLVRPKVPERITLSDLKSCKMTDIFFDTFFNLEKFLDHEQRDPFTNVRDPETDGPELSDWEKFAAEEYENLLAEVGVSEDLNYEDDFEPDDEDSIQEELISPGSEFMRQRTPMSRTTSGVRDPYYYRNGDLHF